MFPHKFIILVTFNFETFTVNIIFILSIFIKNNIYCKLERLIQHSRDKHPQKRRRFFNTRVSIDLYQPSIEVLIQNKVIPKYLKAMFPLLIHYRIPDRIQGYPNILFNFFDKQPKVWYPCLGVGNPWLRLLLLQGGVSKM